ncbi:hypothetical protein ACVWYH_002653 [Bradyrhizobium sp. GM24.11]
MNDLHVWLSERHHGLRTFRIFQQKIETLGRDDPDQRGLCRLLSGLVDGYVEAFDEAPLPVEEVTARLTPPACRSSSSCSPCAGPTRRDE